MSLTEETIHFFNFIGSLVCHRRSDRTLWVGGSYLPVCARDTGAFIGLLLGYTTLLFLRSKRAKGPPNLYLTQAMILPLMIDSVGQALGFWISTNDLRLLTGLLFGTALAPLLVYTLGLLPTKGGIPLLRRIQPETAVLDDKSSWFSAKALFFNMLLSFIFFVIIREQAGSNYPPFYWMLSLPTIASIIWHFLVLPLLLAVTALRRLIHREAST